MKQWNISVTWQSEGKRVMEVTSDNPIEESAHAFDVVEEMISMLPVMSAAGKQAITKNGDSYDERSTTLTVCNGARKRSIRVVQHSEMTDEEADQCATTVLEWLLSPETAEMIA